MGKKNPVVHFELPAEDRERMVKFYSRAFGWEAQVMGPEMGNYVVVKTSETEENGMPKKVGMINGGFYMKTKDAQYPTVVIAVEDIHAAMKTVEEVGGKVLGGQKLGEPDDIPGVGLYVSFVDTEGNRVGMIQPNGMMGMP